MASTVADIIEASKRHLLGMHRGMLDQVGGGGMSDSVLQVTVQRGDSGISEGSYLACEDELMYVWVWEADAKRATVQRGMLGSVAAAHNVGAIIEVDPRFFRFAIREEIGREIRSWYPRLFRVATTEFPVATSSRTVDTSAHEILHLLRVVRAPLSGNGGSYPAVRYRWERGIDRLTLEQWTEGTTLSATYATTFDTSSLADAVDLVTDVGLSEDMLDILPYGVAWRLLSSREIGRTETDAQAEPRDSAEVPPGHIIQTARALKTQRDERVAEAARLLQHKWGVRISA